MDIKAPRFQRTYEFFKALADLVSFGTIAQKCGKEIQTAEAWGRPPESNENPNGSGRKNPLDVYLRLIAMAHKEDAGLARRWASIGTEYVDYLDGKRGLAATASVCELAAIYLKEHAELLTELLHTGQSGERVITELADVEAAFNQLKTCIREQQKNVTVREFAKVMVKGRAA